MDTVLASLGFCSHSINGPILVLLFPLKIFKSLSELLPSSFRHPTIDNSTSPANIINNVFHVCMIPIALRFSPWVSPAFPARWSHGNRIGSNSRANFLHRLSWSPSLDACAVSSLLFDCRLHSILNAWKWLPIERTHRRRGRDLGVQLNYFSHVFPFCKGLAMACLFVS